MVRNRKILLVVPALFILSLLVACGGGNNGDSESSENRDTLVIAVAGDIASMDLHGTNDNPSSQVNSHIFETLVNQDENMELQPGLAHDWRPVDDRVWEFDLLEDVYFHNGELLTAHDVAFTMERASRSPRVASFLDIIDASTIEVVDDHTVRIGTYEPFAPFLRHLAHTAAGIMNELAVEEAGDDVDREPVGTGPFQFVSWTAGDRITLERNENYHGEAPQIRELVFRMIGDGQARTMAVETGEVDIILNPLPVDLDRLDSNNDLNLIDISGLSTGYMGLNFNHEHLNNPLVRQAINYVLDNEAIVNTAFEGRSNVSTTHIAPGVFGFNPDVEPFPHDVERARELMAEAGLEDGFSFTITVNSENQQRVDMATIIRNQLQEINISTDINQLEWATFLEEAHSGNLDAFFLAWGAVTGDADYALFPSFHSTSVNGGGNSSFFVSEYVDGLLDEARRLTDEEDRLEAYKEILEVLREEAPWVLLNQDNVFVVTRANVRGLVVHPTNTHIYTNVYFAD